MKQIKIFTYLTLGFAFALTLTKCISHFKNGDLASVMCDVIVMCIVVWAVIDTN